VSAPAGVAGVVLAAGLGTRLRPLTDLRPKALCPVANVALVDLALARLDGVCAEVAVNVCAGRAAMEQHLAARPVHLSVEDPGPLGTAGALGRLRPWVAGRAVVIGNADAWHRFEVARPFDGWDGERIRLLVVRDDARGDFGPWRYIGSALMPWAEVVKLEPVPSGLSETSWAPAGAAGRLELVPAGDGPFFDCGRPDTYLAANLAASGGESVIGPGAVVDGEVIRSVVWPDAVVAAGERLVECIRAGRDVTVAAPQPPAG
jgi:N-acetyl-alpha-D-muramate 1-phosphate uridylyltransferase